MNVKEGEAEETEEEGVVGVAVGEEEGEDATKVREAVKVKEAALMPVSFDLK